MSEQKNNESDKLEENKKDSGDSNKNGLLYEEITDLKDRYNIVDTKDGYKIIEFNDSEKKIIQVNKFKLHKYMEKHNKKNMNIKVAHGCKCPDEAYVIEDEKKLFIIEKKFQHCSGSTCEKIQTGDFKKKHYRKLFPSYKVEYIFCLSDWFKLNCESEIEYLEEIKIPIFWGNDANYKDKIILFMIS